MPDDTLLPFPFPTVSRKKVSAAFDGGRISSDGGAMLLALADRQVGLCEALAAVIPDRRDPTRVTHCLADLLRARIVAIALGHADGDDLDSLRGDPALKLACGRLPDSGADLCSQPTCSRLENAPGLRDVIRLGRVLAGPGPGWAGSWLGRVLVDLWCRSYAKPPKAVTLDIDDTLDVVHGRQQLSLFNAHYDERGVLPIHIYDTETARPVAVILRPGRTPTGVEIRGPLRRLFRQVRQHWPTTRLTIRGDGHYARSAVMDWCEANGVDYIFGLTGSTPLKTTPLKTTPLKTTPLKTTPLKTTPLKTKVEATADAVRTARALEDKDAVRGFTETTHRAGSWSRERRVVARIEATRLGLDIRFIVTSLAKGTPAWLYESLYCARGQAENLIKLHKAQLGSDRTSCRAPLANQVRRILHTAAYWLILTVRDAVPRIPPLAKAEFTTLRLRLLKVGARVIETAARVRIAFAAASAAAARVRGLAAALAPAPS